MLLNGTLRETLDFPSPMVASCGTTAEKSIPGFAVPDSVHQLKFVSPRKLPLRRTETMANNSAAGTSTVSVVISTFEGKEGPADLAMGGVAATGVAVAVDVDVCVGVSADVAVVVRAAAAGEPCDAGGGT